MDPNIMKLLEEDEDETMHSGADVDAFTAALNRDIEGDNSMPHPSDSDTAALSQGSNNTSSQFLSQWQPSNNNENASCQNERDAKGNGQHEGPSSEVKLERHISGSDSQEQQDNPSQGLTHPPLQHEPSPMDTSQQMKAEQVTPQVSQELNLTSTEKNPVHGHEPGGTQNRNGESDNPKLQSMSNQQAQAMGINNQTAMATGMSSQPVTASGVNNQPAIGSGLGNHQPMMSNQQSLGTGMNNQQMLRLGMNHQPSTASGMNSQQTITMGMGNQHPLAMGLGNQQTMAKGMGNQHTMATGMGNQQTMTTGMGNQQTVATGMGNQQSMATGMSNQQTMVTGISNQQTMATGMSNQQTIVTGMSNQQTMATGMSNQQSVAAGMSSQQALGTGMNNQQAMNSMNRGKQVPFALLLPVIQPQLDKDRGMQLQTLYHKLKKNEISKDGFVRHMRSIVGDQMLKMAVYKLQIQSPRNTRAVPSQQQMQVANNVQMPTDANDPNINALQQREVELQGESRGGLQGSQMPSASLNAPSQERDRPAYPVQGLNKQQQQHLHFSQPTFPAFGSTGNNYHPLSTSNATTSAASLKQPSHDSQMRHIPAHQSVSATQLATTSQTINMMNAPRQNSLNDQKRAPGGSLTQMANNSPVPVQQNGVQWHSPNINEQRNTAQSSITYVKQEPADQPSDQQQRSQLSTPQGLSSFSNVHIDHGNANPVTLKEESFDMQSSRLGYSTPTSVVPSPTVPSITSSQMEHNHSLGSRMPPVTSPLAPLNNVKTPSKKPSSVGQKKPLEALGSSPPPSSKKQKVSGAFLDQSIEQLNDVTAVSGVNLREEEEQLFSGTKEESRVSEASRRFVQEEEERILLQKIPLQKKLAEIMAKCGLKGIGSDVEKCLSLCVEERMRGLISNLIRLSKQRVDIEKPRHRTIITSDVRQQINAINRKARDELEKKQAEAEKLQKLNEPEGSNAVDGDKEKDEARSRAVKVNKDDDSKLRTNAANVAARAAFGGDDMLSKWQLMAEQARQKREGSADATPGSQGSKDAPRKSPSTSGGSAVEHHQAEKRGHSSPTPGSIRKIGRNQMIVPQNRVARSISVKDVIAVLEREPQMSKSMLMYRLYEKVRTDATAE